jgi:hypothetical protein
VTGFQVQPEDLRRAGQELDQIADRLDALLDQAGTQLDGYADPFGTDDIGSLIAEAYEVSAEAVFDLLVDVSDGLRDDAEDLSGMADAYQATDGDALVSMDRIGSQLGGSTWG